jgi:arylsulfatase A-like enzyme
MRKFTFAAALVLAACRSSAQPPIAPVPGAPKLLIVISVDQFSADLWDEYRPHFTGGFARLASGVVFRNGYQSHGSTETCPGHSTILTGARPARTGIVSNGWVDPDARRTDKTIYCAEDENAPGSSYADYTTSPVHLRVPTLGDLLKRQSPASLNVAVSGKDRSAVMMSGRSADQRWYWRNDRFRTDLRQSAPPHSVAIVNRVTAAAIARAQPPLDAPPLCAARAQRFALERAPGKIVGDGRFGRAAGDARTFRWTPQFDAAVLAMAASLVRELRLGSDAAPDILAIGLAGTDYMGHGFGSGGQEMCLQLLSLDRDLGDFFVFLDRSGIDYAVALTADHGGLDIPERLRAKGVADAAWIDPALAPARVGARVAQKLGLPGPLLSDISVAGDVYLSPGLPASRRAEAVRAVAAEYRSHPQIEAAFTKADLAGIALPNGDPTQWSIAQRVRASFDPQRSGDIFLVFKPHIMPILDARSYVTAHGSPWDHDRRVPILFWRPGMAGASRAEAVETVDIMPTLAAMLGVKTVAGEVDGECLTLVPGVRCEPR